MENLTRWFERRISAFLRDTGMSPSELGKRAVGDPSFWGDLRRGRSPRLVTVERVLAFMEAYRRSRESDGSPGIHQSSENRLSGYLGGSRSRWPRTAGSFAARSYGIARTGCRSSSATGRAAATNTCSCSLDIDITTSRRPNSPTRSKRTCGPFQRSLDATPTSRQHRSRTNWSNGVSRSDVRLAGLCSIPSSAAERRFGLHSTQDGPV